MADVRGDEAPGDADPAAQAEVARLQHARPSVPQAEHEQALARLRASLFGGGPPGPRLERYPIERCLGRGGGGTVYLARDRELDRPVAIKVLGGIAMGTDPASSRAATRLLSEAEALARAPHPNVLAIYDLGTFVEASGATAMFLVLEYVEGQDLRHWLQQRQPWRRVLEIFMAAGRGLAAAHRAGVVHRDVKPANLMLGDDGRVRVVDFGLARGLGGGDAHETLRERGDTDGDGITAVGTIVGTPGYMAPEQHEGREADATSDQYGFCVSLWEALLGARPFGGASLEALAAAKRAGPRAPPPRHRVAQSLIAALRRGLSPRA
ncbi:MAG: serine/threonine protein kinase, partial [Nannocystaceae bacterium]|nr:serine/threonine protein kinase [Nannocystaceae bacterium]